MREKLGMTIMVIAALCIIAAVYIFTSPNKEPYIPPAIEKKLTNEEISGIVNELMLKVFAIYEDPKSNFSGEEEDNNQILVYDYETVVNSIFSENGKKELEKVKFDGKNYVEKKDDGIYIMANIPENKKYSEWQINTKDYYMNGGNISLFIIFGKNTMLENGEMSITSKTVELKIIKSEDAWLVDSLNYNKL